MKTKHTHLDGVHARRLRRLIGATALVAAAAAALAACGSSDSSAGDSPSASAGGGAASACVTQAQAKVAADEKAIQFTAPSSAVDMSKLKGKTVFYIAPDMSIPFIQAIAQGFSDAAKAAGLKPVVFDGKADVNTFNQGVSEAVAQHAGGLVLQGENPALVSGPLKQAEAQGMSIVDSLNGDPDGPFSNGVQAHVTVDYTLGGKMMADEALAESGCTGDIVFFTQSIYTVYTNMLNGFKSEISSLCPSCAAPIVVDVDASSMASKLPTLTTTELTRYPSAKVFVAVADGMAGFMTPSIQEANSKVVLISHDGVQSNLAQILAGSSSQVATVGNPPNAAMGWAEIDQLGRLMSGAEPITPSLPQQLFVKSNIASSYADMFPGYSGYESAYEKVWGAS